MGKGADMEATDSEGKTPLTWANVAGRIDTVKALVSAGADVSKALGRK